MIILNGAALLVACYLGTSSESGIAPLVLVALSIYITIVYTVVIVRDFEDKLNEHIDATTVNEDSEDEDTPEDEEEDTPEDAHAPQHVPEDGEVVSEEDVPDDISQENGLEIHTEVEDEHYCAEETCCKQIESNSGAGKCARCNLVYYCNQDCQKKDWKAGHKLVCQAKETLNEETLVEETLDEEIPDEEIPEPVVEPTVEPTPTVEPIPTVEPTVEPVVETVVKKVSSKLLDITAPDPLPAPSIEPPIVAEVHDTRKRTLPPPPPRLPPPPPFII